MRSPIEIIRSVYRRSRSSTDRARITIVDLFLGLIGFAFLGVLYPVYVDQLEGSASQMSAGEEFIFQLVLPFLILIVFAIWIRKGAVGS